MKQDKLLDKILIEVLNTKDQLGTFATREDLTQMKNEILGDVDRFVRLHETLDTELTALRSKHTRLEERLEIVERKLLVA
jgi:hypothetical protein